MTDANEHNAAGDPHNPDRFVRAQMDDSRTRCRPIISMLSNSVSSIYRLTFTTDFGQPRSDGSQRGGWGSSSASRFDAL
jgi:predicted DNA-binding transcriptional regulator AlpA